MAEQLTDLKLKHLRPATARKEIPDGKISGLYFVLQPSGARSWALRYRAAGKPAKLTIGAYPAIDLAAARRLAQKALGEVAEGKDPAANKQAARVAAREERLAQNDLVERVVEQFIERHAKPKTRDWRETERMLKNKVAKAWHGRRLSKIGRADVHALLDSIVDAGAPIAANRTFAQLRRMCRWAVERGIIDQSPCLGVRAPSEEAARERTLTASEIILVWRAFDQIGWPFGPMGKLLLLTGARRDEVAGMRWGEVDLASKVYKAWTIPKERTKNKRVHEIPLTDAAVAILKALPRIGDGRNGFVLTTTGATAISGFSRAKAIVDATILKGMREEAAQRGGDREAVQAPERWTFHDLRRTVATNLQGLGIKLEVTEAVLNHVSGSRGGIVGVYQKYEYVEEKRAALEAWGRYLDALVSGAPAANVVELAKVRAS